MAAAVSIDSSVSASTVVQPVGKTSPAVVAVSRTGREKQRYQTEGQRLVAG
jgi:hypothetical protein